MIFMERIKGWADRILALCCIVLCAGFTVTVTWQVAARFLFNSPGAQSEELAKIMFVWLVLFATALLFGERGHMNIGIVCDKLPRKLGLVCQLLSSLVILGFAVGILLLGGLDAVSRTSFQTNAAMPFITTGQIYAALPICGGFTVFYCVYNILQDIRKFIADGQSANGMEG